MPRDWVPGTSAPWVTREIEDELERLWSARVPLRDIIARMSHMAGQPVTKGQVMGKVQRMGLPTRKNEQRKPDVKRRPPRRIFAPPLPALPSEKAPLEARIVEAKARAVVILPFPVMPEPIATRRAPSARTCEWIEGDARPWPKCGAPAAIVDERIYSWCEHHCRRVFMHWRGAHASLPGRGREGLMRVPEAAD